MGGLYWRLSAFYFFYFASLGALVPYWSLYLRQRGFDAPVIGEFMAVLMGTKIVAPYVWGWIADHSGRRVAIVRLGAWLAALAFTGVFVPGGRGWLLGVMALFSFFWNASLPQFEATTLNHLGPRAQDYSRVRLWGSIGFILTVAGLGGLLDRFSVGLLLPVLLGLFVAIGVSSLGVPEGEGALSLQADQPLRVLLRQRTVAALLLVCLLNQASHGPYYAFFTLYMEDQGYSRGLIGLLWALGVVAEILVFLFIPRLLPRWGPRPLLLGSLVLTVVRWVLLGGFPALTAAVLLAQVLHAASFGVYHAVAIHLIHRLFRGRNQGRGQALYSSLSFGVGGALGSLAAGQLWGVVGGHWAFFAAALTSALAVGVAWWGVRPAPAPIGVPEGPGL